MENIQIQTPKDNLRYTKKESKNLTFQIIVYKT